MSAPEFKSCLDCRHYLRVGKSGHLCTLPPECAPPRPEGAEDDDQRNERDAEGSEYLGTICDVMRRMGALCGPRGALWEAKA